MVNSRLKAFAGKAPQLRSDAAPDDGYGEAAEPSYGETAEPDCCALSGNCAIGGPINPFRNSRAGQ